MKLISSLIYFITFGYVGITGFEPVTSRVWGERSEPAELNALILNEMKNLFSNFSGDLSSRRGGTLNQLS